MTIENDHYVGVIQAFRPPNRHEGFRFHYAITRKTLPTMLMVAGSTTSEQEAKDRVRQYLDKFAERDTEKTSTGTILCGRSPAA